MAVSQTHDIGQTYAHLMRVRWSMPPLQLHGTTHEVEEPWRIGRCVLIRLLFLPYALVIGRWGTPRTQEEVYEAEMETFRCRRNASVEEIREDFTALPW